MTHLPILWKFRLLRAIRAKGTLENRRYLAAQEKAEGSRAGNNPLDTTMPWPGATAYNTFGNPPAHVWNYRTGRDGIAATAATLLNGNYPGIVSDLRAGTLTARQMVERNRDEIKKWGTNPDAMLSLL